ncbi:Rieske (2Fe-2S) protein [Thermocrispum municipale]|jgi:Rieske Fe-S protein|uniref:Rieske (2Fe-2S) protein n=1 Tax=Thermocrispum municipale TaxID=37926 RepID=UPI0006933C6F|nr:Rieske (2Fe-2S) protein [Thermocrispum municipale]
MSPERHTRRDALSLGAAAVGAVGAATIAGCGEDEPQQPKEKPERLIKADEVQVGKPKLVKRPHGRMLPGREFEQIILVRVDDKTIKAYSNLCTHADCLVKPKGKTLHCPCHEADYEPTTGEVITGPPPKPLAKVDVHIADGWVMTGTA